MTHNEYYQLYRYKDFTDPSRHYTKEERQLLNCPDQITNYEIHKYLMLCFECRQAEVAGAPIPEVALNEKHRITRIALERPKKQDATALFNLCYGHIPL